MSGTVFCPYCNAKGTAQPVLSPMGAVKVQNEPPATIQPFADPHWTYVCPRCKYAEIHLKLLGTP